ncbi:MAG: T9SS type A sorting domain-containing protein, partial [Crocinitomicaceae bacterium]
DTYFVRILNFDAFDGTMDICITEIIVTPPPTNVNCGVPDPICSGTPINFTAQANGTQAAIIDPGNNYDCLFTSPNPSWYYLEIDTGGDLAIDITAGSDIDFAIWGPFADLATAITDCNSYGVPVDCSFSPAPVELASVNGVLAGEVYVLLVTNFANTVQTINLVDAPGNSALTDCSNVPLPVELIHFSGMRNDREVMLNWTTATELDNDYFVVERSDDGQEWQAFDLVFGSGTSTEVTDYEVTDSSPFDDVTYYRLRQVDYSGNMNFSKVIAVDRQQFTSLEIYPNPGKNSVTVRSERNYEQLKVTDIHGKEIISLEGLDEYQTHLEVADWKNGIYYVTLSSSFGARTERLVILR